MKIRHRLTPTVSADEETFAIALCGEKAFSEDDVQVRIPATGCDCNSWIGELFQGLSMALFVFPPFFNGGFLIGGVRVVLPLLHRY